MSEYDPMAAAGQNTAVNAAKSSVSTRATSVPAAASVTRAPVSLAPVKVSLGFGNVKKKETKPKPAAKFGAFGVAEEEESTKKKMTLVPLDYTEEEKLAVKPLAERVAAAVGRINEEHKHEEPIQIPTEKQVNVLAGAGGGSK